MDSNDFNNTLIKDLGLEGFPKDIQDEIISRLGENVLQRVTLAIADKIPSTSQQEFDSISQAGDGERMRVFLNSQIPDFDNFVKGELHKTVEEFKQIAAGV